jgi:methylmalonyl-CoA epimerase
MTIARIDHTAVAVRDLDEAIPRFERLYGVLCREREIVPDQAVEVAFLPIGDTQLELICPLGEETGVARYLNSRGESLHHIAVQVDDIEEELARLKDSGTELIDRAPRRGVHGRIAFVHPRGTGGVLLELVEIE